VIRPVRTTVAPPSSPRASWLLVVVLAFWVAQMHGFAHGVSHLGRAHVAPHAALCADCVASADAGAAPTPAKAAAPMLAVAAPPDAWVTSGLRLAAADTAYRSRAPPTTV